MKSQTRALVRHISPFGNPIKEDNPFSLPPQQFFASSPSSRRNLIFRKKKTLLVDLPVVSICERRRTVRFRERRENGTIAAFSLLRSSRRCRRRCRRSRRLFRLGFLSILRLSLPSWFSANNFDFRAWHCTSLSSPDDISQEYVTRRSFGNINRRLRRYVRQIFPSRRYYIHFI